MPMPPQAADPGRRATAGIALGLGALVFLVFGPLLGAEFVNFDDPDFVLNNPRMRGGLSAGSMAWAFQATTPYWQPLTWLSYLLDVTLFGLNPRGFHFTNLLLHALNSALLFLALQRLTGSRMRSALAAALFAFHPLHVETVAWVAERKGALSSLFFLLALLAYAHHAAQPSWRRLVPVALCYALGLMAKSMVITLPAVLLLLDLWPLRRLHLGGDGTPGPSPAVSWRQLLAEKLVLLPFALGSALVTLAAQGQGGHVWSGEHYTPAMRLAHGLVSYAVYLRKTLLPFDLTVFYPHPLTHAAGAVAGAILVLLAVSAAAIGLARRWPVLLAGWGWYLVMLLPVVGFLQTGDQAWADRYTYLPLIGIFLIAVWGGEAAARALGVGRRLQAAAALLAVCACAWLASAQARTWANTRTLFQHALRVTPDNYLAHAVLAHELARAQEPEEALQLYARALELKPAYFEGRTALGNLLAAQQRLPEAASNYVAALAINPDYADALSGLGNILLAQGRHTEALARFNRVVELQPDSLPALGRLAWLLATHRDDAVRNGPRAVQLATHACALTGDQEPLLLNTLAAAQAEAGRFDLATATARRALALAQARGLDQIAGIIQQLIARYEAGQPYRE